MRIESINGYRVEIYDSVSEIPMERFNQFSLYLMMDADIGGDAESVGSHINRMTHYIQAGKMKELSQELENYAQNLNFIVQNISPKYLSFVSLIKSINGIPVDDFSPEGAARLMKKIGKARQGFIWDIVDSFKKKSDEELMTYYPKLVGSGMTREYHILLKQRTLLVLDTIITGVDHLKEIDKIDGQIIELYPPRRFFGSEGLEVKHQRAFERSCILLSQHLSIDPKRMNVLEYYEAVDVMEKKK